MVSPSAQPASRYRRRILGLGALATGCLYVIGAPIFARQIESDLEERVPAELAAAGFEGLTASFSGQDGTLTCEAPLDDPEGARAAAYDVRGVHAIELDRSCRVNTATGSAASGSSDLVAPEATADENPSAGSADEITVVPSTDPDDTSPDDDLVAINDIVAANPELAFLAVLLADSDIGRSESPVTLFAPTNAAFDAVPSDVLGRLQNDPVVLDQVLGHHVVEGALTSADLEDGELVATDGTALTVSVGDAITIDSATLSETDILASNGVVHVIDAVLIPPDLLVEPEPEMASAAIMYDGERMTLMGVAASEVERQILVQAAVDAAGVNFVDDELTVDPDTGVDAATAERLASLVRVVPPNLLSGVVGFDGTDVSAEGVQRSPAAGEAFVAAAVAVGADATVTEPPEATSDDAVDLEAQLNAFVAENPILFEPSSANLAESAFPILERVADDALQFGGLTITVEGHTDSDGVAIENQQLSQNRAEAVRVALVERGLVADSVQAVGFGSERPVLVDGVEDKAASRRVEFRVVAAS